MYVRIPGINLIVPTVYTVTAAAATIDRPGSTLTRAVTPSASQASRTTLPHCVIVGASSVATYGNAEPAAEHELGQAERRREPRHHLGRLGEARRREHVRSDVAVQPDEAHAADDRSARSTARSASPLARLNPNFESS